MVTVYKMERKNDNGNILVELRGLSTDSKPTSINGEKVENGSSFIEIDSGDVFLYDLAGETWEEV